MRGKRYRPPPPDDKGDNELMLNYPQTWSYNMSPREEINASHFYDNIKSHIYFTHCFQLSAKFQIFKELK